MVGHSTQALLLVSFYGCLLSLLLLLLLLLCLEQTLLVLWVDQGATGNSVALTAGRSLVGLAWL